MYRDDLETAVGTQVLDADRRFCCRFGAECRNSARGRGFAAGQLSYVGDDYAVTVDGRPRRVLVVSMQVGDDEAPVDMARRREQVRARIPQAFNTRNQHMAGVTTALRVLFGGAPGTDRAGEFLPTSAGAVHLLDAYAMANSVLCSRLSGQGRQGDPSRRMIENCSSYLATTIEVLEPTVVQSQGRRNGLSTHQAVERLCDSIDRVDDEVAIITVGKVTAVWCSLKHPARNWGQLHRRYLQEVALPALTRTRELASLL